MAGLQQVFKLPMSLEPAPTHSRRTQPTMQATHQMHEMHMAGSRSRALLAVVCSIPAFNTAVLAGSWSYTDLTSRKPGAPPG